MLYGKDHFENSGIEINEDLKLYSAKGCEMCNGTGYKGRLGIHELMAGTMAIKKMIKTEAPTDEIFRQAAEDGMTTLIQDGIHKIFQGLTDLDEVRRVCVS